jgi:hypothetical protein
MADRELNVAQMSRGGKVELFRESTLPLRSTGGVVGLKGGQNQRADPYSLEWALLIIRPISKFVLWLLAVVMLLPFLEIVLLALAPTGLTIENLPAGTTPTQAQAAITAAAQGALAQRSKDLLDWAKTILPSAVGFGSAMMGYYFGTRSTEGTKPPRSDGTRPSEPEPDETTSVSAETLDLRS